MRSAWMAIFIFKLGLLAALTGVAILVLSYLSQDAKVTL